MVVARVREGGRVLGGCAREWTTSGRSNAQSTAVGGCSTCAGIAITATSIARTGDMTPRLRASAESPSAGTGGAGMGGGRRRLGFGAS